MLRSLVYLAGVVLLLVAARPAVADLPTVEVKERWGLAGANDAFFSDVGGKRYVFKSANPEGEYLAARMMQLAGIPGPEVQLVRIKGDRNVYSMATFIDKKLGGARVMKAWQTEGGFPEIPTDIKRAEATKLLGSHLSRLDLHQIRLLQVMDVLIGNPDRHIKNFFLSESPTGLRMVPIDHNLALGGDHFVRGFQGRLAFTSGNPLGSPDVILSRNPVYDVIVSQPGAVQEYTRLASDLKGVFSDPVIQELVASLPPEVPTARRQEILETLRFRRDHLALAVEAYVRAASTPAEQLSPLDRMRLAGQRTTSATEEFLTRRILNRPDGRPTTNFSEAIAEAYAHLRRAGIPPAEARQALHHTLTTGETVLPPGTLNLLEPSIAKVEPTLSLPHSQAKAPSGGFREFLATLGQRLRPWSSRDQLYAYNLEYLALDQQLRQLRAEQTSLAGSPETLRANLARQNALLERQTAVLDGYLLLARRSGQVWPNELAGARAEAVLKRSEIATVEAIGRTPGGLARRPAQPTASETVVVGRRGPTANEPARNPGEPPPGSRTAEPNRSDAAQSREHGAGWANARESLKNDFVRGGIFAAPLVSVGTGFIERRIHGDSTHKALRGALHDVTTAEFWLGNVLGGSVGAAAGSMLSVAPAMLGSGLLSQMVKMTPAMAGAFLGSEVAAKAVTLHRQGRLSWKNLGSSIDLATTAAGALGSVAGTALAAAVAGPALTASLKIGPIGIVPLIGGLVGSIALTRAVNALRSRPGANPEASASPHASATASASPRPHPNPGPPAEASEPWTGLEVTPNP
jgi:hypothetical protein